MSDKRYGIDNKLYFCNLVNGFFIINPVYVVMYVADCTLSIVRLVLFVLLQLVSQLAEAAVLNAVLKHVNQMVTYYACFPKLTKLLLKVNQPARRAVCGD